MITGGVGGLIMAPCGLQCAGEVLGAEREQHLIINNLLLFVCFLFICVFLGPQYDHCQSLWKPSPDETSCSIGSVSRCFCCSSIIHRHTLMARPNCPTRRGHYRTAGVRCVRPSVRSPPVWSFVKT